MAKPEWGIKRHCYTCSTKFYDLNRSPIICPKCQGTFDPEAFFKVRRGKAAPVAVPLDIIDPLDSRGILDDAIDVDIEADDVESDAPLMEDADDLIEGDDVIEVIEHHKEEEDV